MAETRSLAAVVVVCTLAGACTGGGGSTGLGLPSASELNIGALPSMTALVPEDRVVGLPTEVYTRVARGALTCWFGAAGPLKPSYIYHAEAEPPSKGGRSEIVIFEKDQAADDPRSMRAYRVQISMVDDKTKLEIENLKIPEPLAARLKGDVDRWAANEEGCGESPITAGWSAAEKAQPQPAAKKKAPASAPRE